MAFPSFMYHDPAQAVDIMDRQQRATERAMRRERLGCNACRHQGPVWCALFNVPGKRGFCKEWAE